MSEQGAREFLFRSLDDLEAEHAAGNIDDATYERLHSDYTARAAAVLRADDEHPGRAGPVASGAAPKTSTGRRVATVLGVVGFAVVVALVLASALGGRAPGGSVTGNNAGVSDRARQRTLERAVQTRPQDPQTHLALARFLLARRHDAGAFVQYSLAASLDPANAEAQAYSGWLLYLSGAVDDALTRLDAALAAQETYPDAHFFTGMALLRGKSDPAGAIPQFQRYLTLVPDGPQSDQVRSLLADAVQAAGASPTTPGAVPGTP